MTLVTIHDLRCDTGGRFQPGPGTGVRFVYHPGVPELRDDSGLACSVCWDAVTGALDLTASGTCAACGAPAPRRQSLHVRRFTEPGGWRLCGQDAVGFLNGLRTTAPKLDPETFRFPAGPDAG